MEEKETIQPIEITWEELQSRDFERYILVDTRGDEAVNYGMIPGAIAIPECELVDKLAAAAGDKKVILYCSRGQNSKLSAEYFREQGMDVYSLQGGYTGWLLNLMQKEQPGEKENERAREIEKSIRKKFHKVLFSRFAKAINEYDMIQENDKIAVCISWIISPEILSISSITVSLRPARKLSANLLISSTFCFVSKNFFTR